MSYVQLDLVVQHNVCMMESGLMQKNFQLQMAVITVHVAKMESVVKQRNAAQSMCMGR